MSVEDVELASDWAGEDGAFVSALVAVRFLDGDENTFTLHDWQEHNPWAAGADARSAKARWNAAKRHHGVAEADRLVPEYAAIRITSSNASSNDDSNASSKTPAVKQQNSSNAPSPSPSPSPSVVGAKRRKAQVSLPEDFEPNATGIANAQAKRLDIHAEVEKFRNHHTAKGSVMADWQAAWRTWVGNARPGSTMQGAGVKRGSDEYAALHRNAAWWHEAGFASVWEAIAAQCWHDTAQNFHDGKRIEVAA